jgi:lipase maturation factor 1
VQSEIKVASPPDKPVLIYDGDCNFCKLWIKRWRQTTRDRVEYVPFQDAAVAKRFPEISRARFEQAVHLILPQGTVFSGAEAAFRTLAQNPDATWFCDWYQQSPLFRQVSEGVYRLVARHRPAFSLLTRIGWGAHVERPTYFLVRWIFLRGLALTYLAAFVSLWVQIHGLVGTNGILPANLTIAAERQQFDRAGIGSDRYHLFPTLCWFGDSDRALTLQCAAGTILSVILLVGVAPAPLLFLLWLIYLSLSTICQEFLSFQWDILLLETGFLAIFFAPLQFSPRLKNAAPPSRIMLWLLRWLLFRLMFESGCVKLLSGDVTWHNFTALFYHYETQPLPTWIAWYVHQLPHSFQKTSTALMFFIELAGPFLIFFPRRLRHAGCFLLVLLQIFILLTGNYCFFNLLTILLCATLLDDFALQWLFRLKLPNANVDDARPRSKLRWPAFITVALACVIGAISLVQAALFFGGRPPRIGDSGPSKMLKVYAWLGPFRSFNTYGLFSVMTTTRNEIIFEGSNDGTNWLAYEFKYKPGDVLQRPMFVAPHQPRLDWQMWFAAFSDYRQNPWLINFCLRLLQGSPEVLHLLRNNPFPSAPPRYVRAEFYEYHFTDWASRRRTGAWWRREYRGLYLPPISLRETDQPPKPGLE